MMEGPGLRGGKIGGDAEPGPLSPSEVILYPEFIDECAEVIGRMRTLANKNLHGVKSYSRGEKNEEVDAMGVKGELLYRFFLFLKGKTFEAAKLYDDKPVKTWDVLLGGRKSVDVKVMPEGCNEFRVNCAAHKKKVVDWYVFVCLLGGRRVQFFGAPYGAVSGWAVKEGSYGAPYYVRIFNR